MQTNILKKLAWEQCKALEYLNDQNKPNIQGYKLCTIADCNYEELFMLEQKGLITDSSLPSITNKGKEIVVAFKKFNK